MALSSVFVVGNALRLRRYAPPRLRGTGTMPAAQPQPAEAVPGRGLAGGTAAGPGAPQPSRPPEQTP